MRPAGPTQPHGTIPNTPGAVSFISFILGGICFLSFSTFLSKLAASGHLDQGVIDQTGWWWATPQLGFFLAAWSIFHWGEFTVTAGWNRDKCSVDSFLLDNGILYHIAHATALTEYILSLYFRPMWKSFPYVSVIGIVFTILGQALRSGAMIHASTNFSHQLAYQKAEQHRLVTDGVYAWFRHPSYAGFFYWALGTQLLLQNPISFILYSILLWRFFYRRIQGKYTRFSAERSPDIGAVEEASLIRFFGDDYKQYRKRVGTKIPFVP
ncbi:ICMT-domain-containing protein [Fomitiporia mediterranea MF3/22]|uniref:ICMT-domain-containing protein n=1 Tax=Fomitiporia mediterranea (strain MF3/22) TaxID=694068 RepID=UPI000440937F|nr:ICMT-domain-containing protein [Fomitiporia mediterranea MF3/22]EJD01223.1 ICMT-domain-containing protein [Fomitiporia mediterranea MF3/22]